MEVVDDDSIKKFNIASVFSDEAKSIIEAWERCKRIHDTNIRAAGGEVEIAVREFFERMLPRRFHVTQGHLIDRNKVVSPQLDIIISDNTTIPSLLTSKDGTAYIPIDSVYAIAEIKSAFHRSKKYIKKFADTLKFIREKMTRPLIENTAYGIINEPKPNTTLRDIILEKPHKYLNPLFSFMLFVDSGDVREEDIIRDFTETADENLPCMTVLLNYACVLYMKMDEKGFGFNKYPWMNQSQEFSWFISPIEANPKVGSLEGNHLLLLYFALLNHLNESFLEPPYLIQYLGDMLLGRKSTNIAIRKSKKASV